MREIIGVIRLDVPTYEAIEHDESATSQAGIIVAIAAIASAIGAFLATRAAAGALDALGDLEGFSDLPIPGLTSALSPGSAALQAFIGAFIGWALWSGVTYFVGTRFFGGQATFGEMLRVIGFAQAPRILGILAIIPCLPALAGLWSLVCGFIAVRQGLDLDNGKAILTILASWVVTFIVSLILAPIYALLTF